MKINGTIFSKPQQDQLKRGIGAELDKVVAKIDGMLNYIGDWASGNEYHENDVVTWTDGHLYEVIKAHTSSSAIDPSNTEYYKAMTTTKYKNIAFTGTMTKQNKEQLINAISTDPNATIRALFDGNEVILRPIHTGSSKPRIGGVVRGTTELYMGVIEAEINSNAGNPNYGGYIAKFTSGEALSYKTGNLPIRSVTFMQ